MDNPDSIQKIQADIAARYERQLQAVKNAFMMAIEEYQRKWHELPIFKTDSDVNVFVQSRPELMRAIGAQDLVLKDVSRIAREVLAEQESEKGIKLTK